MFTYLLLSRIHANLSKTGPVYNSHNYRVMHGIIVSACVNGSAVTARCTELCIRTPDLESLTCTLPSKEILKLDSYEIDLIAIFKEFI